MLETIFSNPDRPRWMTRRQLGQMSLNAAHAWVDTWAWRNGIEGNLSLEELKNFIEG
jgi:hypothetical protein